MTATATPENLQAAADVMKAFELDVTRFPDLTPHDRCDAGECNQKTVAQVRTPGGLLHFCGHHFQISESKFVELGYRFEIHPDDRWWDPKPVRGSKARDAGSV